jgi:hypothetical protein
MNAVQSQEQIDAALELAIDAAYDAMLAEPEEEKAISHFCIMRDLIAQRSQTQIERMQRERRLEIKRAKA